MRCTYCGSTSILWDEFRGDVVCLNCGTVIDRIYVASPTSPGNGAEQSLSRNHVRERAGSRVKASLSKHTRLYIKLLKKAKEKNLIIDNEKFLDHIYRGKPLVKVFKRRKIVGLDEESSVRMVMNIMGKYPRLNSRTDRARVALALISLKLVRGERNYVKSVAQLTGLTEVHVRRLTYLLKNNRDFIDEVRKALRTASLTN